VSTGVRRVLRTWRISAISWPLDAIAEAGRWRESQGARMRAVSEDDVTILFVGLGAMGLPMARNLAGSGVDLRVHDAGAGAMRAAEEAGLATVTALAPLPAEVTTVVLMLPSSAVVESVLEAGLLADLPTGALVIDMGSSEPSSTTRLAAAAAGRGIAYVDAPVSGGVARAVTGELAIMAGGTDADVERARPLLEVLGGHIAHVGPSGSGHAAKALNNLLSATNIAAAAEILTAAAAFGIRPAAMLDVINASTGRSQASEVKYPAEVLTGRFASGFRMDLMLKDLAIAASLTSGAGLDSPVTDAAARVARSARALTGDNPDHTELVRHYESASGIALRADSPEPTTPQEADA
jgi:3-hydroxyisobutyrate dehydrogenase